LRHDGRGVEFFTADTLVISRHPRPGKKGLDTAVSPAVAGRPAIISILVPPRSIPSFMALSHGIGLVQYATGNSVIDHIKSGHSAA
jgi:hypothetical protein